MASVFEHTTCGRCGGSGNYSYNQMDGSRCYGCDGTGNKYTKRGLTARNWWKAQSEMRADQVEAGMRVEVCGLTLNVQKVEPYTQKFEPGREAIWLRIDGQKSSACVPPEYKVVRVFKGAEARALLQRAVEFQATLPE